MIKRSKNEPVKPANRRTGEPPNRRTAETSNRLTVRPHDRLSKVNEGHAPEPFLEAWAQLCGRVTAAH
jgi:hypothetical protein